MDAPEEEIDIKLTKISSDIISDFNELLPSFLKKRSCVRTRDADRLVSSVSQFQELPQLLDPHLPKWLPGLAEAYLEHMQARSRGGGRILSTRSGLLMRPSAAICRILYTFCKVRGEKVVVRFLNNETKYLELLLSAIEESERRALKAGDGATAGPAGSDDSGLWTWEERYVALLWLSHLMLVPFDLATISSFEVEDEDMPTISDFSWPARLPGVAVRILPLAIKYLASPGKERDAAKALLIRISNRRDMQQLGVLDALVKWCLGALGSHDDTHEKTPYYYIGILSYLGGILVSSTDTSDLNGYLTDIFHVVHGTSSGIASGKGIYASALARKTIIKVIRSVAVLILRNAERDAAGTELIETTIGHLLESLADSDTPVRFAASKALSIITQKLDAEMASQVVEAVLGCLNRNVLQVHNALNPTRAPAKDLSAVDALEWHGLMLTLSHLLYRRSPPADDLAEIIHVLLLGLSFEKRSASGSMMGSNVRDAACFGIWALARRYTTSELLAVATYSEEKKDEQVSVLQTIATELVVTACLDPAGNIRRGSSAALQELIGRHPDTIDEGIWVVQTVDYHAVALRSRAMQEVALNATKLSPKYGRAILNALLGWRGVGDADVSSRRAAGSAYGAISAELATSYQDPVHELDKSVMLVRASLGTLQVRQVEERHGLLFCFAAVLDALPDLAASVRGPAGSIKSLVDHSIEGLDEVLTDCVKKTFRRPELIAESTSRLIVSFFPVFQEAILGHKETRLLIPGPALIADNDGARFAEVVASLNAQAQEPSCLDQVVGLLKINICSWLGRTESDVIAASADAAVLLFIFCTTEVRGNVIQTLGDFAKRPSTRAESGAGYFAALARSYTVIKAIALESKEETLIRDAILFRWTNDKFVETRVSVLQSLAQSVLLRQNAEQFLPLIAEGLDDYTTTARGDVGSLVRLEAIRATASLWKHMESACPGDQVLQQTISKLFLRVLRLAAEKLDRIRGEAQQCLSLVLSSPYSGRLRQWTFSSKKYFGFLLSLHSEDWLHPSIAATAKADAEQWMDELMAGYVSSADTGNEDLVIASRAALCDFMVGEDESTKEAMSSRRDAVCAALVRNLKRFQGNDRLVVPTLEIVAFMLHVDLFTATAVDYKGLCSLVQKACLKTGNVRKIEACIRVYGAIAALSPCRPVSSDSVTHSTRQQEGAEAARKRLGALMFHPWPLVRSMVVDQLWGLFSFDGGGDIDDKLTGVDWGKADKTAIRDVVEKLGLA